MSSSSPAGAEPSSSIGEDEQDRRPNYISFVADRARENLSRSFRGALDGQGDQDIPRSVPESQNQTTQPSSSALQNAPAAPFSYPSAAPQIVPSIAELNNNLPLLRRRQVYEASKGSEELLDQFLPLEDPAHFDYQSQLHVIYYIKKVSTIQCDECKGKGKGEEIYKCATCIKQICKSCMESLLEREQQARDPIAGIEADEEYRWNWQGEYRHEGLKYCYLSRRACMITGDHTLDVDVSLLAPNEGLKTGEQTVKVRMIVSNIVDSIEPNDRDASRSKKRSRAAVEVVSSDEDPVVTRISTRRPPNKRNRRYDLDVESVTPERPYNQVRGGSLSRNRRNLEKLNRIEKAAGQVPAAESLSDPFGTISRPAYQRPSYTAQGSPTMAPRRPRQPAQGTQPRGAPPTASNPQGQPQANVTNTFVAHMRQQAQIQQGLAAQGYAMQPPQQQWGMPPPFSAGAPVNGLSPGRSGLDLNTVPGMGLVAPAGSYVMVPIENGFRQMPLEAFGVPSATYNPGQQAGGHGSPNRPPPARNDAQVPAQRMPQQQGFAGVRDNAMVRQGQNFGQSMPNPQQLQQQQAQYRLMQQQGQLTAPMQGYGQPMQNNAARQAGTVMGDRFPSKFGTAILGRPYGSSQDQQMPVYGDAPTMMGWNPQAWQQPHQGPCVNEPPVVISMISDEEQEEEPANSQPHVNVVVPRVEGTPQTPTHGPPQEMPLRLSDSRPAATEAVVDPVAVPWTAPDSRDLGSTPYNADDERGSEAESEVLPGDDSTFAGPQTPSRQGVTSRPSGVLRGAQLPPDTVEPPSTPNQPIGTSTPQTPGGTRIETKDIVPASQGSTASARYPPYYTAHHSPGRAEDQIVQDRSDAGRRAQMRSMLAAHPDAREILGANLGASSRPRTDNTEIDGNTTEDEDPDGDVDMDKPEPPRKLRKTTTTTKKRAPAARKSKPDKAMRLAIATLQAQAQQRQDAEAAAKSKSDSKTESTASASKASTSKAATSKASTSKAATSKASTSKTASRKPASKPAAKTKPRPKGSRKGLNQARLMRKAAAKVRASARRQAGLENVITSDSDNPKDSSSSDCPLSDPESAAGEDINPRKDDSDSDGNDAGAGAGKTATTKHRPLPAKRVAGTRRSTRNQGRKTATKTRRRRNVVEDSDDDTDVEDGEDADDGYEGSDSDLAEEGDDDGDKDYHEGSTSAVMTSSPAVDESSGGARRASVRRETALTRRGPAKATADISPRTMRAIEEAAGVPFTPTRRTRRGTEYTGVAASDMLDSEDEDSDSDLAKEEVKDNDNDNDVDDDGDGDVDMDDAVKDEVADVEAGKQTA
jgi:hypothetical protein